MAAHAVVPTPFTAGLDPAVGPRRDADQGAVANGRHARRVASIEGSTARSPINENPAISA